MEKERIDRSRLNTGGGGRSLGQVIYSRQMSPLKTSPLSNISDSGLIDFNPERFVLKCSPNVGEAPLAARRLSPAGRESAFQ
jgi:hypothetical protein